MASPSHAITGERSQARRPRRQSVESRRIPKPTSYSRTGPTVVRGSAPARWSCGVPRAAPRRRRGRPPAALDRSELVAAQQHERGDPSGSSPRVRLPSRRRSPRSVPVGVVCRPPGRNTTCGGVPGSLVSVTGSWPCTTAIAPGRSCRASPVLGTTQAVPRTIAPGRTAPGLPSAPARAAAWSTAAGTPRVRVARRACWPARPPGQSRTDEYPGETVRHGPPRARWLAP